MREKEGGNGSTGMEARGKSYSHTAYRLKGGTHDYHWSARAVENTRAPEESSF